MEHSVNQRDGVTVLALKGDNDHESSTAARRLLLDSVADGPGVLVDMSGVAYIDSSGVASLVEAYQAARAATPSFALVAVSDTALRVLELARLDKVFSIHATLEAALNDAG